MKLPPWTTNLGGWRRCALAGVLLALISMGESRIFQRLLFVDPTEYGFVLANVQGVLEGRPVSKSWQQRWLGPSLVVALDRATGERLASLKLYGVLMLTAANLVLFAIALRCGNAALGAVAVAAAWGFVHILLMYKLEYPWDAIDILLMLVFGHALARGARLAQLWPLMLVGLFNHETILYLPLLYGIRSLERPAWSSRLRGVAAAAAWLAALSGAIYALRELGYRGPLALPGQTVEVPLPVVENHLHVMHNLRQWWWADFHEGRSFISLSLSAACLACVIALARGVERSAALWTLLVLASIVCFGYVNETRHYLLLAAFWFAYACPRLQLRAAEAPSPLRADAS